MASIKHQSIHHGLEYNLSSLTQTTKPWEKPPCATKLLKVKIVFLKPPKTDTKKPSLIFQGISPNPHYTQCKVQHVDVPHAKNIAHTQHYPTCFFLCIQRVVGVHHQQSKVVMPNVYLHQENISMLINFVNEFETFFKVSTILIVPSCLQHISHKVILNINMFCLQMISWVLRQENCTLTIAINPYSMLYQPNTLTQPM